MLWPRHTCPFGLPDDAEDIDNVILYSIGHVLRATAVDITGAALPVQFVRLLRELERREERTALVLRSAALRQPRTLIREPVRCVAERPHADQLPNPLASAGDQHAGIPAS
jgi:hypothetical protein